MPRSVRYSEAARRDLQSLVDWIVEQAGVEIALSYVDRIEAHCERLAEFPRRGRLRRRSPPVRSIPFRRNATILYRIGRTEILILRVLHSGRDVEQIAAGSR